MKDMVKEVVAGALKGPGVPDGSGPWGGQPECQLSPPCQDPEVPPCLPVGGKQDGTGPPPWGGGLGPGKGKMDGSGRPKILEVDIQDVVAAYLKTR